MTRGHRLPAFRVSLEDVSLAALPAALVSGVTAVFFLLERLDHLPYLPHLFAAMVGLVNLAILWVAYKRPLLAALGVGLVDLYWYLNVYAFSSPDSPNYYNILGAIAAMILGDAVWGATVNPYLAALAAASSSAAAVALAGLALRRLARLAGRLTGSR